MNTCCNTPDDQQDLSKQETPLPEGAEPTRQTQVYRPLADIFEADDQVTVRVNMPGVNEERVDLTLEKNVLTIRGRVVPPDYAGYELAYREYGIGDYERAFQLTNEIDREGINATVKDGVLSITLPKVKTAVSQKIAVSAG